MTTPGKPCTVMVLVKTKPEYQEELVALSTKNVEQMKKLPGFIAHTLLKSQDGTLVISRIEWEKEADHKACENHACWTEANKEWARYLDSGKATIEVHVLSMVQRIEAQPAR